MSAERSNNEEISLKELLLKAKEWIDYLQSKFKIILLCGIVGALLGLGYALIQKTVYTASLTFALEDEKSGGGISSALAGQFGLDLGTGGGGMFSGSNLIELFKSRKMVEKTLLTNANNKKTLADEFVSQTKMNESWADIPKLKNLKFPENPDRIGFSRAQDSILGVIANGIIQNDLNILQKEKKVSVITVEYKCNDEQFAKNFTETLAKEVSEFYIETKIKKAKKNLTILTKQTDSVRSELNGAITGVAVATDNTFGLNPALNIKRVPSSRRQVDVQANTAILTELVKQSELAKITLRKETPLIQVIDKPIYPLTKTKFSKLKGIIFGSFLGIFLSVLCFVSKRFFNNIINN